MSTRSTLEDIAATAGPNRQLHGSPDHDMSSQASPVRILAIGHREGDAVLLRQALETLQVHIDRVSDDNLASAAQVAHRYDLLVLFSPLGGTDSLALCRQLRSADSLVPIVIVATIATDADLAAGFEAGADAYIVAPVHAEELRARVMALLRRSGAIAWSSSPNSIVQLDASDDSTSQRRAHRAESRSPRPGHSPIRQAGRAAMASMARSGRIVITAALVVFGTLAGRCIAS